MELVEEINKQYSDDNKELALKLRPDLDGLLFIDEQRVAVDKGNDVNKCFSYEFVKWVVDQWKVAHDVD